MDQVAQEILALESICNKIKGLEEVKSKMEGGLTRQMAFESDRIHGTKMAMEAYYTAKSQSEKVAVALEMSTEAITAAIVAGIGILIGIVIKIISWIRNKPSSSFSGGGSTAVKEVENKVSAAYDVITEIKIPRHEIAALMVTKQDEILRKFEHVEKIVIASITGNNVANEWGNLGLELAKYNYDRDINLLRKFFDEFSEIKDSGKTLSARLGIDIGAFRINTHIPLDNVENFKNVYNSYEPKPRDIENAIYKLFVLEILDKKTTDFLKATKDEELKLLIKFDSLKERFSKIEKDFEASKDQSTDATRSAFSSLLPAAKDFFKLAHNLIWLNEKGIDYFKGVVKVFEIQMFILSNVSKDTYRDDISNLKKAIDEINDVLK